eukprot:CAMPEP_0198370546 /NCGR_PEP_ID=MMETSP1450-20131203/156769_1 /TAXON_ID=753684 ORGANISM="Madagascaria erythrocladiodes, Strain CCMP3234" /NCGR_SAMPLE_ID=MMETSP1450 /ASSEMBLY_ACC=CAM_ASM_001115 /LENGTH=175 /DNA_ID=CAMNT_0044078087 /DNA_START=1407 /DNA_END=1934 /DNA_ORIENTATION=-
MAALSRTFGGHSEPFHTPLWPWLEPHSLELPHGRSLLDPMAHMFSRNRFPGVEQHKTRDGDICIAVDVPGVRKEDIEVHIRADDRLITIKATRRPENLWKSERVKTENGQVGGAEEEEAETVEGEAVEYERAFRVPGTVDLHRAEVSLQLGVLKLVVPQLHQSSEPVKVAVKSED